VGADTIPIQQRHHVFLPAEVTARIDALKPTFGKSRPEVIKQLLELHGAVENPAVGPPLIYGDVMSEVNPTPACCNGPPRCGKSYAVERFIMDAIAKGDPVLVMDVGDNQSWVRDSFKTSDLSGFPWPSSGCSRVTFSADPGYRKQDMQRTVEDLNRKIGEGKLKDYALIFEDSYEFGRVRWFREFIAVCRKHCKACVVVSQDFDPFKPFCRPFGPLPRKDQPAPRS
jgi:hypothetical protein